MTAARSITADTIPAGQVHLSTAIFEARAQDANVDDICAQAHTLRPVVADHGQGPVCEGYHASRPDGGSLSVTCDGQCLFFTTIRPALDAGETPIYRYSWPLPARIRRMMKGDRT